MSDNTQDLDEILRQYPRLPHEQDEIRHALLDWHNKQTLELLDRLLERGEDFTTSGDGSSSVAVEYIEAERNQLKEVK